MDDVKKLCLQCRKSAKSERVLFHYNGHGVPRPTMNGELWFFNKVHIRLRISHLVQVRCGDGFYSILSLDLFGRIRMVSSRMVEIYLEVNGIM